MTPKEQFRRAYSIVRYDLDKSNGDYAPDRFDEKRYTRLTSEARGIPPAMLGAAWLCYEIDSRRVYRRPYQAPGKYQKMYEEKHRQQYVMTGKEYFDRLKAEYEREKGNIEC